MAEIYEITVGSKRLSRHHGISKKSHSQFEIISIGYGSAPCLLGGLKFLEMVFINPCNAVGIKLHRDMLKRPLAPSPEKDLDLLHMKIFRSCGIPLIMAIFQKDNRGQTISFHETAVCLSFVSMPAMKVLEISLI